MLIRHPLAQSLSFLRTTRPARGGGGQPLEDEFGMGHGVNPMHPGVNAHFAGK
jgi:hypothetical protein